MPPGARNVWSKAHTSRLRAIEVGDKPKALIGALSEDLLTLFRKAPLVDDYDAYQRLPVPALEETCLGCLYPSLGCRLPWSRSMDRMRRPAYPLGMAPLPPDYLAVREKIRYVGAAGEEVPVSELGPGLTSTSREKRKATWEAIYSAWAPHAEQVLSALNEASHIKVERLGPRPTATEVFGIDDREALAALADFAPELMDLLNLRNQRNGDGPFLLSDMWLQLPAGHGERHSFEDLWQILTHAIGAVIPSALPILERIRSDGRIHLDGRSPYCALSEETGLPHVYLPFSGILADAMTLAHEIGHAVHCELSIDKQYAPRIFGEIFSQLFEDIVRLDLAASCDSQDDRLDILYNSLFYIAADFLLSTALLDFERRVMELRSDGPLSLDQVVSEQDAALRVWFGMSDDKAGFWMRSHLIYETAAPFYSCLHILGHLMSLLVNERIGAKRSLSEDEFDKLVKDTFRLDPITYLTENLGADPTDLKSTWQRALRPLRERYRPLFESRSPEEMW